MPKESERTVMQGINESKAPRANAQSFALVAGLVYVVIGVAGFVVQVSIRS